MASTNINMLNKTGNNAFSDECYTPKDAVLPLLPYLDKSLTYHEPTSGKSKAIVNVMSEYGFSVTPSLGLDFLAETEISGDVIITNPPYSKKDAFISKCYSTGKPFALLLPVSAIQGQRRGLWFDKHGIELLVLNKRLDFTGKGAPHFGVAWFCHNILPQPLIFV